MLEKLFKAKTIVSKEEIAKMLQTTPKAIEAFEQAYTSTILSDKSLNHNAKTASLENQTRDANIETGNPDEIIEKISDDLLAKTEVLQYNGTALTVKTFQKPDRPEVTPDDLTGIPLEARPQLTGNHMKKQCGDDTAATLLYMYKRWQSAKTRDKKALFYNMFRQGLDILDLDVITWRILGMNRNAIGNWFPELIQAVTKQDFFKVPATSIVKVPLPLLQLTRLDYELLTYCDRQIANRFCMKAFDLDVNRDYFIKTGTFSSKFDFRNAKVTGESEVRTLGEYLLFIQNQAVNFAGSLNGHPMYGASTTNEWVVREFIHDTENNPAIYMGMPLHTEYRAFVDFDEDRVIDVIPYWHPDVMKPRFANKPDSDNPHMKHDWVMYSQHEPVLMRRFSENKDTVSQKLQPMLKDFGLTGQWSVDIMQNGEDFYIIDMALAANSALTQFLPKGSIRPIQENWIPTLT